MAGTTALPTGTKGSATDAQADAKAGWDNVAVVLGDDLGNFLRRSRGKGRHRPVVTSSEGGPATRARVKRISELLSDELREG